MNKQTKNKMKQIEKKIKEFRKIFPILELRYSDGSKDCVEYGSAVKTIQGDEWLTKALQQQEERVREEAIKEFGEYIISAGLVDETDFRYEMKEYLEEDEIN